jgi:uncharacterized protein (TIGR02588 family)
VITPGTPLLERLLGGLGLLVVLGILGALLRETWVEPEDPLPHLRLSVERVEPDAGGWLMIIAVRNEGRSAAEAATIEAALRVGGAELERHLVQVDEIAPHGEQRVGVRFTRDPASAEILLEAGGFTLP